MCPMSITEKLSQIKGKAAFWGNEARLRFVGLERSLATDLFVALLFLTTGLICFGLGRISVLEIDSAGVSFQPQAEAALVVPATVIASKTGTKYHLPWCSGAISIKEGNKLVFENAAAARKAGYAPASNCKGIE
jgi:hypothetical protein